MTQPQLLQPHALPNLLRYFGHAAVAEVEIAGIFSPLVFFNVFADEPASEVGHGLNVLMSQCANVLMLVAARC